MAATTIALARFSEISVSGGNHPTEITWSLSCTDGTALDGLAPFAAQVAIEVGAQCTLEMFDSNGNGWNGARWTAPGFGVDFTLDFGSFGFRTFTVQHAPPSPPAPPTPPPPLPPTTPPSPSPSPPPFAPPSPPPAPPLAPWQLRTVSVDERFGCESPSQVEQVNTVEELSAAWYGCADTDNGATDPYGDGCTAYTGTPAWCGGYDDEDFTSTAMCCACGSGTTPPSTCIKIAPGTYNISINLEARHRTVALVAAPGTVTLDGGGTSRLLYAGDGADVTVAGVDLTHGWSDNEGGAVYANGNAVLLFDTCRFYNNTAAVAGGAIYFYYDAAPASLTLRSCELSYNVAGWLAGCIRSIWGTITISDSTFYRNCVGGLSGGCTPNFPDQTLQESWGEGAALQTAGTDYIINNTKFIENRAFGQGGVISISTWHNENTAHLTGCDFLDNLAEPPDSYDGGIAGAMFVVGSHLLVSGSRFLRNVARGLNGAEGGAIKIMSGDRHAGLIQLVVFDDCLFEDNAATSLDTLNAFAGVLSFSGGMNYFTNCTFRKNSASGNGGVIHLSTHPWASSHCFGCNRVILTACLLELNSAGLSGGALFITWDNNNDDGSWWITDDGEPAPDGTGRPELDVTGSIFRKNTAANGNTIMMSDGFVNYVLPAPPGYWAPALECRVRRTGTNDPDSCELNVTDNVDLCGEAESSSSCSIITLFQTCAWQDYPAIVGQTVFTIEAGKPINDDFPYPCAPGVLGGTEIEEQTDATCKGLCPEGFYCPTDATVTPIECDAGSYCPLGSSSASACAAGSFSNVTGLSDQSQCNDCSEGALCRTGATSPTQCSPGSVQPASGQSECALCEAGTFQDESGKTACAICPAASFCETGAAAALLCPAGRFSNDEGLGSQSQCSDCPEGSFCGAGALADELCSPGTVQPASQQGSCVKCAAGTYQDGSGETACATCPAGSYCEEGASAPLPCLQGSYSNAEGLLNASMCTPCPAGSFCTTGATAHSLCSPGSATPTTGAASCAMCQPGEYEGESGRTSCQTCAAASFCSIAGLSSPTPCPGGTYSSATGLISVAQCTPVQAGEYASTGSELPEQCPASGFLCPGAANDDVNDPPGSKPIPIASGQATTVVNITNHTTRLSFAITVGAETSELDADGLKEHLVGLYAVDAAALELNLAAAGSRTTVNVRILTDDAVALMDSVRDLDATAHSIAVNADTSAAAGFSVDSVVVVNTVEVAADCAKGHWCSAGNQIACSANTFNDQTNQIDMGACKACPANAQSPEASTSASACICQIGYYDARLTATGPTCLSCPLPGSECTEAGMTLASLSLARGYWRVSNASVDFRLCPDANSDSSACVGGVGELCKNGTSGPLCALCLHDNHYYDDASSECRECVVSGGSASIVLPLLAVGYLLVAVAVGYWTQSVHAKRILGRLKRLTVRISPRAKLKVLWSLYVVASRLRTVYAITLPKEVINLLEAIPLIDLNVELLPMPFSCYGLGGYLPELTFVLLAPLALVFVIVAVSVAGKLIHFCACATRRSAASEKSQLAPTNAPQSCGAAIHDALYASLPWVLVVLYGVSPLAYNKGFAILVCDEFPATPPLDDMPLPQPVASYLVADYTVSCDASGLVTDMPMLRVGSAVIGMYAVATPLFYAALLHVARRPIVDELSEGTKLSAALSFLWRDFRPDYFWWEFVDYARKVALVGFFYLVDRGSIVQLIAATALSLMFLLLSAVARPYHTFSDNTLAVSCDFCLSLLFVWCIVIKMNTLVNSLEGQLSEALTAQFEINAARQSMGMVVTLLFSLIVGFVLSAQNILVSMRIAAREEAAARRSQAARGRMATPPTCKWTLGHDHRFGTFLSHYKVEAGSDARYLRDIIQRMSGVPAYLDSTDLVDLRVLFREGVHKSDVVVILATKDVFTRPWCLLEMWESARNGIPIVLFPVVGGGWDLEDTRALLSDLQGQMASRNPGCVEEVIAHVRRQGVKDLREVEDAILAHIGLVPTLEREGRASAESERGQRYEQKLAGLLGKGVEELGPWLQAHNEKVEQRLSCLTWQPWASDNQILAVVQTLLGECTRALGRPALTWIDALGVDAATNEASASTGRQGLPTVTHPLAIRRPSFPRRKSKDEVDQSRLLIVCAQAEAGGHARMLQEELARRLGCVVGLLTEDVHAWRDEALTASRGVLLLQISLLEATSLCSCTAHFPSLLRSAPLPLCISGRSIPTTQSAATGSGSRSEYGHTRCFWRFPTPRQTKSVLQSPIRLLTLHEALVHKHPLVCVNLVGGGYKFEDVKPFLRSVRKELKAPDVVMLTSELFASGQGVGHLIRTLDRAVPNSISIFFNPNAGASMIEASFTDIIDQLVKAERLTAAIHGDSPLKNRDGPMSPEQKKKGWAMQFGFSKKRIPQQAQNAEVGEALRTSSPKPHWVGVRPAMRMAMQNRSSPAQSHESDRRTTSTDSGVDYDAADGSHLPPSIEDAGRRVSAEDIDHV